MKEEQNNIMRSKTLTKKNKKEIANLFKNGNTREKIAELTGASYAQVCYALRSKGLSDTRKARKAKTTPEIDYKKLYFKAVALLVQHDILKVEL